MTSGGWPEIERLYLEASGLAAADRAAFLDQACAGQPSLRAEVESLLDADPMQGPFLNLPPSRLAADLLERRPGGPAAIGPYRILQVLGEGGMGTVYRAEQQNPHRIVALKVIKAGLMSDQVLRRFEQECEALGRLRHPGIAQIYDAGTADSGFGPQPYFAMEFIPGRPLMDYAAEPALDVLARLELMAKVCDAAAHAHQRAIIHRDLKPGNILVDETGQPKILDFGVARITDSDARVTRQTDLGQMIGTLAYMSPEQAMGNTLEMDIRSDVYSLGVILYELLAGKLPYHTNGADLHEAVQAIREQDAAPLGAVDRGYRGDVETIVARALEKDKERRYASAGQLAGDIRLHLADRPIMARPPTATYQLLKFSRRHRAVVIGTAAVLAALIAGVVASTWQAVRARTAEHTALQQRDRADSAAASAKVVNDFLENDLLAQASPVSQSGPDTRPDPDLRVRTALDRAAARIAGRFDKQPEVEASIRETIGETYGHLGLYAEARRHLERALELRRLVLGVEDPKTLITMARVGQMAQSQGMYPQAEAFLSQTLEIQRRVLGPEHRDTLDSTNSLSNVYFYQGKFAQSEALVSQTLEIERRVLGPEHPSTLNSTNSLANAYLAEGRLAQAEALYSQNLETRRRVCGPEHPDVLAGMRNLAETYTLQGKYAQAETLYRQNAEIQRRVLGPEHANTLNSIRSLAIVYNSQGKYAQGELLLSQTLEISRRALGPEHPDTLFTMNNLAVSYAGQGRYAPAEALLSQTLELKRRVLGLEHHSTLATLSWLAKTYSSQGKYAQAEPLFRETLELRRRVLGPEDRDTLDTAANLALAYQAQGKFAASEPLAREVEEINRKERPDDWQGFLGQSLLGASLTGQKKYAEAQPLLLAAFRGMNARKDRIVQLYRRWGKPDEATAWREK